MSHPNVCSPCINIRFEFCSQLLSSSRTSQEAIPPCKLSIMNFDSLLQYKCRATWLCSEWVSEPNPFIYVRQHGEKNGFFCGGKGYWLVLFLLMFILYTLWLYFAFLYCEPPRDLWMNFFTSDGINGLIQYKAASSVLLNLDQFAMPLFCDTTMHMVAFYFTLFF